MRTRIHRLTDGALLWLVKRRLRTVPLGGRSTPRDFGDKLLDAVGAEIARRGAHLDAMDHARAIRSIMGDFEQQQPKSGLRPN